MARSFLPSRRRYPTPVRALHALAVLLAVVTVRLVVSDITTLHDRVASRGPLQPVVVARHAVAVGTRLRAADLRVLTRHRADIAPDGVAAITAALGRTVAVALVAGAEVTRAHLAPSTAPRSTLVTADTRLVHVLVDDPDPPEPGTVVDVVSAAAETGAAVVAAGAVVVAAGTSATTPPSNDGAIPSLRTTATSVTDRTVVALVLRRVEVPAVASAVALGAVLLAVAPLEEACCRP